MRQGVNQVSYGDVYYWADEIERAFHCHVHFTWHGGDRLRAAGTWDIRAVATWQDAHGKVYHERGVSARWPTNEHSTVAGLMMYLLYQLDHKIEEDRQRAQDEARRQGRLF